MRLRFILILIFILFLLSTRAQNDSTKNEVIAFHPFHLVNIGIRVDYDRHLGKNHWIQIGPQFYAADKSDEEAIRDFNELIGAGLSVNHRIYVGDQKPYRGTYFSYGLTFNYFNLKYNDDNQMGITSQAETSIKKFGGDIIIGYQTFAFDRLVIDIYAGLGGRYSEYKFKGQTKLKFNDFLYDYGFTGNILLVGVRLGLGF